MADEGEAQLLPDDFYRLRADYQFVREVKLTLTEKQYEEIMNTLYRVREHWGKTTKQHCTQPHVQELYKHDMKILTALAHVIEHERD